MKSQWRINQLLWTGFGVIFIIVIFIAVLTGMNSKKAYEGMDWVKHTYEVRLEVSAIKRLMLDAETGQRGYLFTGRESYLEPYNNSIKIVDDHVAALRELVNDNPAQVKRIDDIRKLVKQKLAELGETIQLKRDDKNTEVLTLVVSDLGKKLMDDLRVKFDKFEEVETELLAQRMQIVNDSQIFSNRVSIGGTIFTILIGIFICLFASVRIMSPIKQTASKISSATIEIASTVQQHERTASQQSTAVNETTTTMEELDKSSLQSSRQAESAAVVADEVLKLSREGMSQMQLAQEATVNLKEKVGGIAEQILQLSEQTSQIQNITILVTDLANQTNLLALNAAVEAARAGEHGKGFAVVAVEIRNLAEESKKSAGQIQTLVSDIQKATNSTVIATEEGSRRVEEVTHITRQNGTVLKTIANSAENAAESIRQISLNSRQQAAAISQVVNAMNSINNGAKETSNGIRQTKEGLRDIEVAATHLNAMI